MAGTTAVGLWLGRRQKDYRDYFVANHAIPWWAVLISVVATETSAITFISIPSVAYLGDFSFLQLALGYVIGRTIVAYTLLPRYFQGELVTAYALLERRFGLGARRFASIVFMVTRGLADSVRVFATAIPISLILATTLRPALVMPIAILILGALTVFYTYQGGMRAVIWTDVIQTSVYLIGGIAAVMLIGNWSTIFAHAAAAGKLRVINTSMDLAQPYTLWAGLFGGAFLTMASHGADQLIVQRLLAASSLRDARRALIGSGFVVLVQFTLFLIIGTGLYAVYQGRVFHRPDDVFPTFILQHMPPGLVGLVVAAILAATMSTHSGAINSLAASTTHDIYLPMTGRSPDDPGVLKMARLFTLGWGVVLTGGALLYRAQGTPVVAVALSIASFTYGALLGAFFLAMLWRRAIQRDAIVGMTVGLVTMAVVVFYPPVARHIAWPWYVLIGTTITLAAGIVSSWSHT
ncbi:MAG TPA: sodium:solute symporter [Gemmatimonadaceae bacterium]|nr:sodium:solute symporter [Gemmatimonadaceae bacterium]